MPKQDRLTPDQIRLIEARHHDPFSVLGRHSEGGGQERVSVFIPGASHVAIVREGDDLPLSPIGDSGLFIWRGDGSELPERHYRLRCGNHGGQGWMVHDPYTFGPQIPDLDRHLFGEGRHWHAYRFMGAHLREVDGVSGVLFATWAPNAERVSVVGDFNGWDGRRHPMRVHGSSGIWELFIPGLSTGDLYKFEIRNRDDGSLHLKADPYARRFELRPSTASMVCCEPDFPWQDHDWLEQRRQSDWLHAPMSIYEVHLGSWRRDGEGHFLNYRELGRQLVTYVRDMGYTHIQLLPITEHPFDGSWGYQTIGYYAATSRFGTPDDLRWLIDHCHQNGIGVFLDWVPAHFPKDAHGLARFDGTALYEHEDPRLGEHKDWGTLIFNFGRNEVKNFLLSSALYWVEEFHIDGLRVDAVASMLYLDYSRNEGEWCPNRYGGRENLEAIDFLREVNTVIHDRHPGVVTMAEESTAWPGVSRPVWLGGLGFSMKWNMGWMNDTLSYFERDPIHRRYHHDKLTFGLLYAFSENFILPFSHDEVVHGKRSLLDKMPGDAWQRFANLRLMLSWMYTQPGKQLLFMGCDFGQGREWNFDAALDWHLLDYPAQRGIQATVRDLNRLHRELPALHRLDFDGHGFEWLDCQDSDQSVLTWLRKGDDGSLVVVALNFTPVPRVGYRIGVPHGGTYPVLFNSDSGWYGGSDFDTGLAAHAQPYPWMGRDHSIELDLPPLAAVILHHQGG